MLSLIVIALAAAPANWKVSTTAGSTQLVGAKTLELTSGWKCAVGDVSANGSRQVICSKKAEEVSFTVQCDDQPKDRAQLRLGTGKRLDYIELQCET